MPFPTPAADYGRNDDADRAKFRQSEKVNSKVARRENLLDDSASFSDCATDDSSSFGKDDGDGGRNGCCSDGSSSSSSSSSLLSSSSSSNSNGTVCPSSSTSVASVGASSSSLSSSSSSLSSSLSSSSSSNNPSSPLTAVAQQLDDPSFTHQEPTHSIAKDSCSVQEEQSSQKKPFSLEDLFINTTDWQEAESTVRIYSENCEFITGDVLPGDSHAKDAKDIKVVIIHGFPVPGLERMMQLNLTKDGLKNKSLDQPFRNLVTRLKEDGGYGMSHDEAVALALGGVAFIDAISAVGDWDLRSNPHKEKYFKELTEEKGLRELMRIIITDVLQMLPNVEKIYAMGAEGFIMLDSIRSQFSDKITQDEKIMHGMQIMKGWADEYQAGRYLDIIDEIASILSGKAAKGFKSREHKEHYLTIGKKDRARYNIRSLDGNTNFGTAGTVSKAAEWTRTDKNTVQRSLKRNDGFLSLNGTQLYQLTIVSNELAVGKTVEGVAEFERRKQEVNVAKQEVISILSIEGNTPLGTTHSPATAAEWTAVSETTFRICLNSDDGILSLRNVQLYRISKGKVKVNDELSFGMTDEGVAAFERRKQEVYGYGSARVDQKPIAKKRKLETKSKDPNTQKKSAFLHYASYAGSYIKPRNPEMKDEEIRMYVSHGWNQMTPQERDYWDTKAKAADDEERNQMELANTNKRSPPLLEAQLYPTYTYHDPNATGRNKNNTSWDVPLHFTLQTSGLFEGFRAWLTGYPAESTVTHTTDSAGNAVEVTTRTPVKPMRLLKNGRLPKQFKKAYDNNYKPVMEVLEEAVESDIVNRHVDEMDHSFLRSTYERAFDAACVKYPNFRTGIKKNWKVSTFCKKVRETNTAENTANGTKRSGGKKRKHTVVV